MFFDLAQPGSVASDSNAELMEFYAVVRDRPDELLLAIAALPMGRRAYYTIRARRPASLEPVERAARFIHLNKTCYNGLYRVNRKGEFNTPFGGREHVTIVDPEDLHAVSRILRQTELRCGDYREVVQHACEGDFVYLDPPYLPLGGYSDFRRYTPHFFDESDHVTLAREFRGLTERGVYALLSNSANEMTQRLYRDYAILRVRATRQINCRANGRGAIEELLVANYRLEEPDGVS